MISFEHRQNISDAGCGRQDCVQAQPQLRPERHAKDARCRKMSQDVGTNSCWTMLVSKRMTQNIGDRLWTFVKLWTAAKFNPLKRKTCNLYHTTCCQTSRPVIIWSQNGSLHLQVGIGWPQVQQNASASLSGQHWTAVPKQMGVQEWLQRQGRRTSETP